MVVPSSPFFLFSFLVLKTKKQIKYNNRVQKRIGVRLRNTPRGEEGRERTFTLEGPRVYGVPEDPSDRKAAVVFKEHVCTLCALLLSCSRVAYSLQIRLKV